MAGKISHLDIKLIFNQQTHVSEHIFFYCYKAYEYHNDAFLLT